MFESIVVICARKQHRVEGYQQHGNGSQRKAIAERDETGPVIIGTPPRQSSTPGSSARFLVPEPDQ